MNLNYFLIMNEHFFNVENSFSLTFINFARKVVSVIMPKVLFEKRVIGNGVVSKV